MWQLLLAAAVAGSTVFVAKHFLGPSKTQSLLPLPEQTPQYNPIPIEDANLQDPTSQPLLLPNSFHESVIESNSVSETQDGIFTFSSSESLRQNGSPSLPNNSRKIARRGSKNGVRIAKVELRSVVQHRKDGRRLHFCFKRRKTTKNIAGNTGFYSSKDSCLFGWGVSFGIMCMMAGKAEISELNKTMNETAKVVEELKSELNRRKSSCAHQILDSVGNIGMESCKMSGRHDEVMLKKTNSELRDTDVKIWSLPVNDDGECGSSALTEEPDPRVLEMDQLEAELEFELQKLPGCTIDTACPEEIRPKLDELKVPNEGCHGTDDQNFDPSQSHGILASELNQKLSHLLIEQQENQIAELESGLHLTQSKLLEKEAELQALKDRVRRLTELPLSTVSDDETEARKGTRDWDSNNTD